MLLSSENFKKMSDEEKKNWVDPIFNFYRNGGFPKAEMTDDEICKDFLSLKSVPLSDIEEDKIIFPYNQAGTKIIKHFSNHFYEVKSGQAPNRPSMMETFNDDELLKRVIWNRISQNFTITGSMIKQGLGNSKIAYKASIFNSPVAKFLYSKYTKENDIIYDYSMGFGQRLLAALSIPHKVKYIGVDPLKKTFDSNANIFKKINELFPNLNKEADLFNTGSELFCPEEYENKVSFAFSSPPYFSLEVYERSEAQAYNDGNYNNFINGWWKTTVLNIRKLLKDDGFFAINIAEIVLKQNIAKDMCNVILASGFEKIDQYGMKLSRNENFRNAQGRVKLEPIVIFKKIA
jgi:hypothetical protein